MQVPPLSMPLTTWPSPRSFPWHQRISILGAKLRPYIQVLWWHTLRTSMAQRQSPETTAVRLEACVFDLSNWQISKYNLIAFQNLSSHTSLIWTIYELRLSRLNNCTDSISVLAELHLCKIDLVPRILPISFSKDPTSKHITKRTVQNYSQCKLLAVDLIATRNFKRLKRITESFVWFLMKEKFTIKHVSFFVRQILNVRSDCLKNINIYWNSFSVCNRLKGQLMFDVWLGWRGFRSRKTMKFCPRLESPRMCFGIGTSAMPASPSSLIPSITLDPSNFTRHLNKSSLVAIAGAYCIPLNFVSNWK